MLRPVLGVLPANVKSHSRCAANLLEPQKRADAWARVLGVLQVRAAVLRDGSTKEIPVEEIVPVGIVIFDAGDIVSEDCLMQESNDLYVDEAMLTGETFPVVKTVAVLWAATQLSQRTNVLWMRTHVVSGSATAPVVRTGTETEFGSRGFRTLGIVRRRWRLQQPARKFDQSGCINLWQRRSLSSLRIA